LLGELVLRVGHAAFQIVGVRLLATVFFVRPLDGEHPEGERDHAQRNESKGNPFHGQQGGTACRVGRVIR